MIKPFTIDDYPMLKSWWNDAGMMAPPMDMLPLETTFICSPDGIPLVSGCLYLMNCKTAMVEHIIGNPNHKGIERKNALELLIWHLEVEARSRGCTYLMIFSYEQKVKNRYEELGFIETLNNVSTFSKEIGR